MTSETLTIELLFPLIGSLVSKLQIAAEHFIISSGDCIELKQNEVDQVGET